MARIANFTSAGVPTGTGPQLTLDALMQRQQQLAQAGGRISANRDMQSPWQGAAYVGDIVANKLNQGRADRALAEGRAGLASAMSGVSMDSGPSPEQIAQVSGYDPDMGMQLWKMAADLVQSRRARELTVADRNEQRSYEERVKAGDRTYEQSDEIADERRAAEAKAAEDARVAKSGQLRIVTGEDAKALGGDPARQYRVSADGTKLEDITPDKPDQFRPLTEEERQAYGVTGGGRWNITQNKPEAMGGAAQPYTSFDKKQMVEDEDTIMALEATNKKLASILSGTPDNPVPLNERAGSGAFAEAQSWLARNDPTGFFDDAKGAATTELNTKVMGSALASLRAIFGGNPTEGERAVLLSLQGAADKSPTERKAIIEDAIAVAQEKVNQLKRRGSSMRDRSYYGGGGGDLPVPQTQEEFDALPPGTRFIDPDDGQEYTK